MNFDDIIKKSFLEGFGGSVSMVDMASAMVLCLLLSAYIFFIYRMMTRKTFYSAGFNLSLVAIAIITTGIIFTIQSNLIISLGMVGALSIVRFRTAVKDPLDLVFMFWAIGVGIICGAGLGRIAVVMSLVLTIAVFIFNRLPAANASTILVVNAADPKAEQKILDIVKSHGKSVNIRSRTINGGTLDLVAEVRLSDETGCISAIAELKEVTSVSLISHDGEVTY